MDTLTNSQRVYDGSIPAGQLISIKIGGVLGLPTGLKEIRFILRVPAPARSGWIYAGPTPVRPLGPDPKVGGEPSTMDYNPGLIGNDLEHTAALDAGDILRVFSTQPLGRIVVDVTGIATS